MAGENGSEAAALLCSFCGKSQYEVRKIMASPAVHMCSECIEVGGRLLRGEPILGAGVRLAIRGAGLRCCFCRARQENIEAMLVSALQGGPTICNECLGLARDIVAEEMARENGVGAGRPESELPK